jgi:hypothetical protein
MSDVPPPPGGDPNQPPAGATPPPAYGATPPPAPSYGATPPPAYPTPGPAAYQPAPAPAPAGGNSNGMAVAALILGILTFFCLGPLGALLAIIFGFLGLKKAKEINVGKGMSIAGIVLGAIGLVATVIFIIVLVVAGSTAKSNLNDIGGVAPSSSYQITPGACSVDSLGTATFEGTIKNTTSSTKNFNVKVEFRNKDNNAVIDTETDLVSDIASGDTAQWSTTAFSSSSDVTSVSCKVLEVDNFLN